MRHVLLPLAVLSACTSLGPMPATTAISAVPADRPGLEAQVAVVPAFRLSDAASKPGGDDVQQLSVLVEPDRWLGTKGVIVGARSVGDSADNYLEPYAGYRRKTGESSALAVVAYGSHAGADSNGASYSANRGGVEAIADGTMYASHWLGVHAQAALSATALSAKGHYCVGADGIGVDCDKDVSKDVFVDGSIRGIYPAATGSLALDVARRPEGAIHAIRVAIYFTVGATPRLVDGHQEQGSAYASAGVSLSFAFGTDK